MSQRLKLEIKALDAVEGQDLVILVSDKLALPESAREWAGEGAQALLTRAAAAALPGRCSAAGCGAAFSHAVIASRNRAFASALARSIRARGRAFLARERQHARILNQTGTTTAG